MSMEQPFASRSDIPSSPKMTSCFGVICSSTWLFKSGFKLPKIRSVIKPQNILLAVLSLVTGIVECLVRCIVSTIDASVLPGAVFAPLVTNPGFAGFHFPNHIGLRSNSLRAVDYAQPALPS